MITIYFYRASMLDVYKCHPKMRDKKFKIYARKFESIEALAKFLYETSRSNWTAIDLASNLEPDQYSLLKKKLSGMSNTTLKKLHYKRSGGTKE